MTMNGTSRFILDTNDPRWDSLYKGVMRDVWPHLNEVKDEWEGQTEGSMVIATILLEYFDIELLGSDTEIWATVSFENEEHLTYLMLKYC